MCDIFSLERGRFFFILPFCLYGLKHIVPVIFLRLELVYTLQVNKKALFLKHINIILRNEIFVYS